jgi:hypothetical protein
MIAAAICYGINTAFVLIAPHALGRLGALALLSCFIAETSVALWLLVASTPTAG